ncbi:hypothetical protein BEL04_14915 [Mucilaginibacter sp. PPCGB 2223]|nr:hypothetical protein BEL04_14915 [Mucilaginibacter sp. PPCGB 2223]
MFTWQRFLRLGFAVFLTKPLKNQQITFKNIFKYQKYIRTFAVPIGLGKGDKLFNGKKTRSRKRTKG